MYVTHTYAHDIYMMQKIGMANPHSLLEKFSDRDRKWAEKALKQGGPHRSKWLKLPMTLLAQLVFKVRLLSYK